MGRFDPDAWRPAWNLSARYCWGIKFQHNGGETLPAAFADPFGWQPWTLVSPYMALCIVLAALSSLALFQVTTRSRAWLSVAPALAMGGAPLFQLYIDGSAALLAGIALVPALLAIGVLALRASGWATTLLGAVLLAGLVTAYPEMGLVVVGTLAIALGARAVARVRAGERWGDLARASAPKLIALALLAVVLTPRATIWALANARESGSFTLGVVHYDMKLAYLPGWLLQTREFYTFSLIPPRGATYALVGIALPIALIAVAVYGCVRVRDGRLLALFVGVASAQAVYASVRLDCSYCVGRTLAVTVPAIAVLLALGVFELTRSPVRWKLGLGVLVGTTAAIAAGSALFSIEQRAYYAYMPPAHLTTMAEKARTVSGTLALEGFGQTPLWAWGENRTTYQAMVEGSSRRVSLPAAYNDYGGLSYFGTRKIGHPTYTPDYEYVLTRFPALETGRHTVYETETMALERRNRPFDAILVRGAALEPFLRDPGSSALAPASRGRTGEDPGPAHLLDLGALHQARLSASRRHRPDRRRPECSRRDYPPAFERKGADLRARSRTHTPSRRQAAYLPAADRPDAPAPHARGWRHAGRQRAVRPSRPGPHGNGSLRCAVRRRLGGIGETRLLGRQPRAGVRQSLLGPKQAAGEADRGHAQQQARQRDRSAEPLHITGVGRDGVDRVSALRRGVATVKPTSCGRRPAGLRPDRVGAAGDVRRHRAWPRR